MRNVLIIGCGLLGSSLVRKISKKKIAKKIFIYEKSKSNITKIKRLKLHRPVLYELGSCYAENFVASLIDESHQQPE